MSSRSKYVQKLIIIIPVIAIVPLILYLSLYQVVYDITEDIAVKSGDDCKLLSENDLVEISKMHNADTRKYFEEFQNIGLLKKTINTEQPPPYCWYKLAGLRGDTQGSMVMTFKKPTAELSKVSINCFDLPPSHTEPLDVTGEIEKELGISWYRCW